MENIISSITASSQDQLFSKMSSEKEGWAVRDDDILRYVRLNEVDHAAINLLVRIIENSKKMVLAVPYVSPGTALGLVSYLTVNRFLNSHLKGLEKLELIFQGYEFIDIESALPIVVITKRRHLRDYFLRSELRFGYLNFLLSNTFPLYRLTHTGSLVPLFTEDAKDMQVSETPPIVFYHFDHIDNVPNQLKNAIVVVELDDTINSITQHRLEGFLDAITPKSVFVLTNVFGEMQQNRFEKRGFDIVRFGPPLVSRYSSGDTDLPSLSSSLRNVKAEVPLSLSQVANVEVDRYIANIARSLARIGREIDGGLPQIFYTAKNIFGILKNLAVPLQEYEDARRIHPYYKTVKHNLDKLFTGHYLEVNTGQAPIIQPIWDVLGGDFLSLYNALLRKNSKYDFLQSNFRLFDSATILVDDLLQAEILRNILQNQGYRGSVTTPRNAKHAGSHAIDYVFMGTWKRHEEVSRFSLLPNSLEIICYESELFAVQGMVDRLNDFREPSTLESLRSLGWKIEPTQNSLPWVVVTASSKEKIIAKKNAANDIAIEEDLDGFFSVLEDIPEDYEEEIDGADEFTSGYLVTLSNGESGYLTPHREVLVYADKKSMIGPVTPEYLKIGDYLLILEAENNEEVFHGLVERTRKLSGSSMRIIQEWEAVMLALRSAFKDQEELFINAMHLVGCDRKDATLRQWLRGLTMAPQSVDDINKLLKVNRSSLSVGADIVAAEMNKLRAFHRRLGKRLHKKMTDVILEDNGKKKRDLLDSEIDEILDLTHTVKIEDISELQQIPLATRKLYALS